MPVIRKMICNHFSMYSCRSRDRSTFRLDYLLRTLYDPSHMLCAMRSILSSGIALSMRRNWLIRSWKWCIRL